MATSVEHEELYSSLRANLLARHFAISQHFRVNYLPSGTGWAINRPN